MEGRFESGADAELTFIGQPNVAERTLDNADPARRRAQLPRLRHVPQRACAA